MGGNVDDGQRVEPSTPTDILFIGWIGSLTNPAGFVTSSNGGGDIPARYLLTVDNIGRALKRPLRAPEARHSVHGD